MKEKRKTRLNKTQGTKTEFLGFGAFADASSSPKKQAVTNNLRWSPIYTGKDAQLASQVFPRLLKRDATTKVKALQDLQAYFQNDDSLKKQQVDALAHYIYMYHSKLNYDSSSSVRAEALLALVLAATRVPKAFGILVKQNNQQILGMMYCCHGDPAAEVRAIASKYVLDIEQQEEPFTLNDVQSGIWYYVERILSYGRANKMQEDLFATSLKNTASNSGKKNDKSNNNTSELNEAQRDQMEERFERIVGTALSGIQVWIQRHGILADAGNISDSSFLWKTFSSQKTSLRIRTYSLLGVCCQKSPFVVFDSSVCNDFAQALPQALAAEKEAGNIAALLEALLAYLAAYSKYNNKDKDPWSTLNAASVTKHLVRIFKKSCYGASATQWGPSVLPLVAMLPSLSDQLSVLTAAWQGREQTVRLGDQIVIVSTVSESASYFLLRKQENQAAQIEEIGGQQNSYEVLAQIWLDCLKQFIDSHSADQTKQSKSAKIGPVQQAHLALGKGLARELRQFSDASHDRPNCALFVVRDFFWQGLHTAVMESKSNFSLAMIVDQLAYSTSSNGATIKSTYLFSTFREKFHDELRQYQQRSEAVPTVDVYVLMIAILKYCGVHVLNSGQENQIENETSIERFLMNDVLRWMVIHTSKLSAQKQTKSLAQKDFVLFGICIACLPTPGKRRQLWESALKEIIAAKCDLQMLIAGLAALLKDGQTEVENVQSGILDNFAIQVVNNSIEGNGRFFLIGKDSPEDEEKQDIKALDEFVKTCVGLMPGIPALVTTTVVSAWVERACAATDYHGDEHDAIIPYPILETLLQLPQDSLSCSQTLRVAVQSWRQGGHVWNETCTDVLLRDEALLVSFFQQAQEILHNMLTDWSFKPGDSNANDAALFWSRKAWRLIELRRLAASTSRIYDAKLPVESLSLVKLNEMSLWEADRGNDFIYSCMMYLFRCLPNQSDRFQIILKTVNGDASNFIVNLLLALSEASPDMVKAARVSKRKDRCSQLLAVLGSRDIGKARFESWLDECVGSLKDAIQAKDIHRIRSGVSLVSQLCDLLIDRVKPQDIFSASADDEDDDSEEFERETIARVISPVLDKEIFAALPWLSSIDELANVLISQSGVGPERGIGSLHYDVFQLVSGAEGRLRNFLAEGKKEDASQQLWKLSLSCGFGMNTPESSLHFNKLLMFDPDKISVRILDFVEANCDTDNDDFFRAVAAWLVTSSVALKDAELQKRAISALYRISSSLLGAEAENGFSSDTMLALRGVQAAHAISINNSLGFGAGATQAMVQLTQAFICTWDDSAAIDGIKGQTFGMACNPINATQPVWYLSCFHDMISTLLLKETDWLVSVASEFSDGLVKLLFVESKRFLASRLLSGIAKSASILFDPTPEKETALRLLGWAKSLDDDEKAELEEDIEIVSEILPHGLMTEVERWSEEEYADTMDDEVIIGRMLIWLSCLEYIDAFVRKDAANRPSLCAYIEKSGALESILNLTILHTDLMAAPKDASLPESEVVDPKLLFGSKVVFRTVEALPSLSRRWWEEECPKVYTDPIKNHVETQIAPFILQSELERLKLATLKNKFGAMTVSGSVSTREITAMYIQDEIQLKVMIRLPPFFPLRNAEVDCSQTLGVPAKRWKLWSLQITMMLNNQGGTLEEALLLWKENVDKEFDGVEPCPVCYSVLHVKTHKLPELECSTCSNRFHVQCLTQWFRSSGKTQCVLCQQPWAGTRVKK